MKDSWQQKAWWKLHTIFRREFPDNFRPWRIKRSLQHYFSLFFFGHSYRDGWDISPAVRRRMVPVFRHFRKAVKEHPGFPVTLYRDFKEEIKEKFGELSERQLQESQELNDFLMKKWEDIIEHVYWALRNIDNDFLDECEYPNPEYDPSVEFFSTSPSEINPKLYKLNFDDRGLEMLTNDEKITELEEKKRKGLELFGKYLMSFWT